MPIFRYIIRPLSPFGTPLRSDTLAGHLVCAEAEWNGAAAASEMLERFRSGDPPFVIGSAFPRGTLPVPILPPIRRSGFPALAKDLQMDMITALLKYKEFRKFRYAPLGEVLSGGTVGAAGLFKSWVAGNGNAWKKAPKTDPEPHNTIDRRSGIVLQEGGLYFTEAFFHERNALLDLYVETGESARFERLFKHVGNLGFGCDRSTGKGRFSFEQDEGFDPAPFQGKGKARMCLSVTSARELSAFKGWYRLFVKHGRVWNGFGETNPYKRPFIAFEEGSVFLNMPAGGHVLDDVHPNPDIAQIVQPLTIPLDIGGLS